MTAVLYAIPASHPCAVVSEGAGAQGHAVPARRDDPGRPAAAPADALRLAARCPASTFDDGTRVSGSRAILRALEGRVARPAAAARRRRGARADVERAEEWGDQVLQPLVAARDLGGAEPPPRGDRRATGTARSSRSRARWPWLSAPLVALMAQQANNARDPKVRADLRSLPPISTASTAGSRAACSAASAPNARGPADRREPAPAAHDGGPARRCSTTARRRAGPPLVPDYPGAVPAGDAACRVAARLIASAPPLAPLHAHRDGRHPREPLAVTDGGEESHRHAPTRARGAASAAALRQVHAARGARGRAATRRSRRSGRAPRRSAQPERQHARAAADGRRRRRPAASGPVPRGRPSPRP